MAQEFSIRPTSWRLKRKKFSPDLLYALVSAALLGLWVAFYVASPFGFDEPGRDTWHHVAVLRELMVSPFAPSNPHIPTSEPSRYFTPIAVLTAIVGKLFALSPYRLFGWLGAATCIGLILACRSFALRYYKSPWAPLILLLALLFLWGAPFGHTGLHTYATFLSSAAYPASIALVLGIFSWSLVLRALDSDRLSIAAMFVLGLLCATILLEHQLSGVFMVAGTGSFALFHERASIRSKATIAAVIATGSLASFAWPYFSMLEVMSSASDPRWKSVVEGMNHVSTMLLLAAPSLLGILGFRKPSGAIRWELVCPAAFFGLSLVALLIQDSPIAHRIPPAIILYNQLGFVWLVMSYGAQPQSRVAQLVALVGVMVVAFLAAKSGADRMRDLGRRAATGSLIDLVETVAADLPSNSISFASTTIVFPLQSTGRRVVSIPRPEPAAPSLAERQAATERFFSSNTSAEERARIIAKWRATDVVLLPSDLRPDVLSQLRALGPSKTYARNVEVIHIDRTTRSVSTLAHAPSENPANAR